MFGAGLLKGLGVTLKHAVETYTDDLQKTPSRYTDSDERSANLRIIDQPVDQEGLLTIQYPEERRILPERFRYIPMLIWDNDTDEETLHGLWHLCQGVSPPVHLDRPRHGRKWQTGHTAPGILYRRYYLHELQLLC